MFKMINMGLYTDFDYKLSYHSRDFMLQVFLQTYMFVMQSTACRQKGDLLPSLPRLKHCTIVVAVILLNMLIALMVRTSERFRPAALMAKAIEIPSSPVGPFVVHLLKATPSAAASNLCQPIAAHLVRCCD